MHIKQGAWTTSQARMVHNAPLQLVECYAYDVRTSTGRPFRFAVELQHGTEMDRSPPHLKHLLRVVLEGPVNHGVPHVRVEVEGLVLANRLLV